MHNLAPYKVVVSVGVGRKKTMEQTMAHDVHLLCDAEEFASEIMHYGGWKDGDCIDIIGKNEKVIHCFEHGRKRWHIVTFAGRKF